MKFCLVDRIESIQPGKSIVTAKNLSMAEEYLADHFPAFPVMPGVLMLEACVPSAAWLVRLETHWSRSMIVLHGQERSLRQLRGPGRHAADHRGLAEAGGRSRRLLLHGDGQPGSGRRGQDRVRCFNLAQTDPSLASADRKIIEQLKQRFALCGGEIALRCASAAT